MYPSIQTIAGRYFDLTAPAIRPQDIAEIAHALSMLCRFTGHCRRFYSVAQHSVLVSRTVPRHLALVGLLHDAHEAYVGDVSAPLKVLLPDFKTVEMRCESELARCFNLPFPYPQAIKDAERIVGATERRDLMPADDGVNTNEWREYLRGALPLPKRIRPIGPGPAKNQFLQRFAELTQ